MFSPSLTSARNPGRIIAVSIRDPENVGLEGNLATLSALVAVLKKIEKSAGETGKTATILVGNDSLGTASLVLTSCRIAYNSVALFGYHVR